MKKHLNLSMMTKYNLVLFILIMGALSLFTSSQQDSIDQYLETSESPIVSIEGVLESDTEPNTFVSEFVDDGLIIEDISKTTHILWHEEEVIFNNSSKIYCPTLYVNQVLWDNLGLQTWNMSFLLYNFPMDIVIENLFLQSEMNNYSLSDTNFTDVFSLPNIFLDFNFIRMSNDPILIFPLENSTLNKLQGDIPEVHANWIHDVNYYLDEDFIINAGRFKKIEDKMDEIVSLVIDNLQPYFSSYDVKQSPLIQKLYEFDRTNYWYFDYAASLFIPVIILFEVLFFYVTKSKFEEFDKEFELYYYRGLSRKQLLQKMFIWSGLWILLLIPISIIIFGSFGIFSQSLVNTSLFIITPWLVTHSLLVLYLIFYQTRIYIKNISQNLTNKRWEMISNELPLLNRLPLKLSIALALYYFIIGVYKLFSKQSSNIEDITILSRNKYYSEFITSFIIFVIISSYLIFKKLQFKSSRNMLKYFSYRVIDRKKIFILLIMIPLFLNFSEFTFLHLYTQDVSTQEEGDSNSLGDYMINFNEIEDIEKLIHLDYSKIPNVIGFLPLLEYSSMISGDGFNFHSGILLLNQTLFSEFTSELDYNNTLLSKPGLIWTSDPLYSFLNSKDSFKIDDNAINLDKLTYFQRYTSGIIEERLDYVNIVMSYETWDSIGETNPFDTRLKIILDFNGSDIADMDKLEDEIANIMGISENDFFITKIKNEISTEIVPLQYNSVILDKILNIYKTMNLLLVIFIAFLIESLIINNAEFREELKTIYIKYGSLRKIKFILLKVHIVFIVATIIAIILGVLHGIYIEGSGSFFNYKSLLLLDKFSLNTIISSVIVFMLFQILVQFLLFNLTLVKLKRSIK